MVTKVKINISFEIILKYVVCFEFLQINSASLLRRKPFREERKIYNKTVDFINNLSPKLDKEKISILVGHVPIDEISVKHDVPLRKVSYFQQADSSNTKLILF